MSYQIWLHGQIILKILEQKLTFIHLDFMLLLEFVHLWS
jgi:hypothetical protein